MKTKALAVQAVQEVTENQARWCQIPGRPRCSHARIEAYRKMSWKQLMARRLCFILLFFLGLPAALSAQNQKGSWSDLNRLKAGQGVEVIESNLKRHAGKFVAVNDELLTLQEDESTVSLKREDVVRVSTSSAPRRGEHAAIGLVVGGLIGAGIGAASGSSTGFLGGSSRGIAALVGIVIGAPSGALVGAVIPAHTTLYRAARSSASQQTKSP